LSIPRLLDLLVSECKKLGQRLPVSHAESKSKEGVRFSIQQGIIACAVKQLKSHIDIYKDANDLIEEIKLCKIVSEHFAEIQQSDLDLLFEHLPNTVHPSKYLSARKIYVPEFLEFIRCGGESGKAH